MSAFPVRNVAIGMFGTGTLTLGSGSNVFAGGLMIGRLNGGAGYVWMTGAQLSVANSTTAIGFGGIGQMTVSNGSWVTGNMVVGGGIAAVGTLTQVGGSTVVDFGT